MSLYCKFKVNKTYLVHTIPHLCVYQIINYPPKLLSSQITLQQDNTQRLINLFIKIKGIVKLSNCQQGRVTMATLLTPVCGRTTRFHQYEIGYIKIFDIYVTSTWLVFLRGVLRKVWLSEYFYVIDRFLRVVSYGCMLWIQMSRSRAASSSRGAPLTTSLRL